MVDDRKRAYEELLNKIFCPREGLSTTEALSIWGALRCQERMQSPRDIQGVLEKRAFPHLGGADEGPFLRDDKIDGFINLLNIVAERQDLKVQAIAYCKKFKLPYSLRDAEAQQLYYAARSVSELTATIQGAIDYLVSNTLSWERFVRSLARDHLLRICQQRNSTDSLADAKLKELRQHLLDWRDADAPNLKSALSGSTGLVYRIMDSAQETLWPRTEIPDPSPVRPLYVIRKSLTKSEQSHIWQELNKAEEKEENLKNVYVVVTRIADTDDATRHFLARLRKRGCIVHEVNNQSFVSWVQASVRPLQQLVKLQEESLQETVLRFALEAYSGDCERGSSMDVDGEDHGAHESATQDGGSGCSAPYDASLRIESQGGTEQVRVQENPAPSDVAGGLRSNENATRTSEEERRMLREEIDTLFCDASSEGNRESTDAPRSPPPLLWRTKEQSADTCEALDSIASSKTRVVDINIIKVQGLGPFGNPATFEIYRDKLTLVSSDFCGARSNGFGKSLLCVSTIMWCLTGSLERRTFATRETITDNHVSGNEKKAFVEIQGWVNKYSITVTRTVSEEDAQLVVKFRDPDGSVWKADSNTADGHSIESVEKALSYLFFRKQTAAESRDVLELLCLWTQYSAPVLRKRVDEAEKVLSMLTAEERIKPVKMSVKKAYKEAETREKKATTDLSKKEVMRSVDANTLRKLQESLQEKERKLEDMKKMELELERKLESEKPPNAKKLSEECKKLCEQIRKKQSELKRIQREKRCDAGALYRYISSAREVVTEKAVLCSSIAAPTQSAATGAGADGGSRSIAGSSRTPEIPSPGTKPLKRKSAARAQEKKAKKGRVSEERAAGQECTEPVLGPSEKKLKNAEEEEREASALFNAVEEAQKKTNAEKICVVCGNDVVKESVRTCLANLKHAAAVKKRALDDALASVQRDIETLLASTRQELKKIQEEMVQVVRRRNALDTEVTECRMDIAEVQGAMKQLKIQLREKQAELNNGEAEVEKLRKEVSDASTRKKILGCIQRGITELLPTFVRKQLCLSMERRMQVWVSRFFGSGEDGEVGSDGTWIPDIKFDVEQDATSGNGRNRGSSSGFLLSISDPRTDRAVEVSSLSTSENGRLSLAYYLARAEVLSALSGVSVSPLVLDDCFHGFDDFGTASTLLALRYSMVQPRDGANDSSKRNDDTGAFPRPVVVVLASCPRHLRYCFDHIEVFSGPGKRRGFLGVSQEGENGEETRP